jgi:iron complex outermembrane recepter protein
VKLEMPAHWTLRAGVFRSIYDQPNSGSDLLYDPNSSGIAQHQYVSYPDQFTGSTSGEIRATHLTTSGPREHELIFTLRARDVAARYGGYDQVDLGTELLGTRPTVPEPLFTYGPLTRDHIRQWTAGTAYALHWRDILDLASGVEQVRYERTIFEPGAEPATRSETPLLYYLSGSLPLTTRVSAYASLTRGLEDSGLAPPSATNRGQLLPPSRTGQEDAGVRYTSGATSVVAGVFEVYKPYYNVGGDGSYTWLGTESHRGAELSLNAEPIPGLTTVVSGVVGVGSAPVSQPRRILQVALDYRPPGWPRLSLDMTATQQGREPVRPDDGAYNPTQTIVTAGGRYRFGGTNHPVTLRVQVQNITNQMVWFVYDLSGGLVPYPPRHMALAYLSADF